jgi:spermidine/putrescine transport system substrate-binding protein
MLRKAVLLMCLSLLVMGLPVLAQDSPEATTEAVELTPWTCPTGFEGQSFNWFNWTTYEAEDTRSNFAELCGLAAADETIMGSNEDLISKLDLGNAGYDVVTPTGTFIPQMARDGLLEPIDLSKIPNFANVSDFLQAPAYDPENMYTVPYQWGIVAVGYNREAVGKDITSWNDVWEYDGNVAWLEDARALMGIALHLLGFDANSTNPDEIAQARDFLVDHGGNVRSIAVDDGQEKLVSGEADIVIEYSGDIYQKIVECEENADLNCAGKYAFVVPEEGAIKWVDNLAIPLDAPNPDLSMAFMDYILDPQVAADISNYTAYPTPVQVAIDNQLISEDLLNNPVIYPSPETAALLFDVVDVGDEAARLYSDAWTEMKTLLGQG